MFDLLLMIPAWEGKMGEAQVGLSLVQSQQVLHLPYLHFYPLTALCRKLILFLWSDSLRSIPCAQKDSWESSKGLWWRDDENRHEFPEHISVSVHALVFPAQIYGSLKTHTQPLSLTGCFACLWQEATEA